MYNVIYGKKKYWGGEEKKKISFQEDEKAVGDKNRDVGEESRQEVKIVIRGLRRKEKPARESAGLCF